LKQIITLILLCSVALITGCPRGHKREADLDLPPLISKHVGDFNSREAGLLEKLKKNPDDTATLGELYQVYLESGEYPRMAVILERLVKIKPDSAQNNINLGCAYFRLGKYRQAKDYLSRSMKMEPDNPLVWEGMIVLARTYLALGDDKKALELLDRINSLLSSPGVEKKFKKLLFGMIVFTVTQDIIGQSIILPDTEEEILEKLEKSPDDPELYLCLVELKYKKGKLEEARKNMKKALKILKNNPVRNPPGPKSGKYI